MQDIEILYQQLLTITDDCFYQLEADFFMELQRVPEEKKNQVIVAFLTISDWHATSLRSGVWTFYEVANQKMLLSTADYLSHIGENEFSTIFRKGIHDYQNQKYSDNYDYPNEWIEEADTIDQWIMRNENWLSNWKRNLLIKHKEFIMQAF